jgi:UDP-glucose 4-epimerase
MNVLIIGSEGFIGRHLVKYYVHQSSTVTGADILEANTQAYAYHKISRLSPEYDELLQVTPFDVCINAAGSGSVPYSMSHPVHDFESNVLDTIRILDGLRRYQPSCKYLHISSAAVYGNPVSMPITEEAIIAPLSPYGWHKGISESVCREYSLVYGLKTAIARPFSVYGIGLKKQLFWDLYLKCIQARASKSIELWGTGEETRDFIHVSDVARAFNCIIQNGEFNSEAYNVATGKDITINQAASLFTKFFDADVSIQFNQQERSGDPLRWNVNIQEITRLGFTPTITIEHGLQQLCAWLKELK